MILLRFFVRSHFEINNKMLGPFFVTAICSRTVKELLAHTLLIYIRLDINVCGILG